MIDPKYKKNFQLNVVTICVVVFAVMIILSFCTSCSKYQVVSELNVNMYHLQNIKTKEVEVILTKDTLQIGKFYKLNKINIIPSKYYNPKKK